MKDKVVGTCLADNKDATCGDGYFLADSKKYCIKCPVAYKKCKEDTGASVMTDVVVATDKNDCAAGMAFAANKCAAEKCDDTKSGCKKGGDVGTACKVKETKDSCYLCEAKMPLKFDPSAKTVWADIDGKITGTCLADDKAATCGDGYFLA